MIRYWFNKLWQYCITGIELLVALAIILVVVSVVSLVGAVITFIAAAVVLGLGYYAYTLVSEEDDSEPLEGSCERLDGD